MNKTLRILLLLPLTRVEAWGTRLEPGNSRLIRTILRSREKQDDEEHYYEKKTSLAPSTEDSWYTEQYLDLSFLLDPKPLLWQPEEPLVAFFECDATHCASDEDDCLIPEEYKTSEHVNVLDLLGIRRADPVTRRDSEWD